MDESALVEEIARLREQVERATQQINRLTARLTDSLDPEIELRHRLESRVDEIVDLE